MDTFFEQIVEIRKTSKSVAAIIGIWFLTLFLSVAALIFLASFAILVIFGLCFCAYKLTTLFNIEYEYIVTNGTMDIDKIINKSSRKRIVSFDLANVSRLEKYEVGLLAAHNKKDVIFACNSDDSSAYLLVAERDGKKPCYIVFSPEERLQGAIVKFVPKYIANSAFK